MSEKDKLKWTEGHFVALVMQCKIAEPVAAAWISAWVSFFQSGSSLVTAVYFVCVWRTVAIQQSRGESFTSFSQKSLFACSLYFNLSNIGGLWLEVNLQRLPVPYYSIFCATETSIKMSFFPSNINVVNFSVLLTFSFFCFVLWYPRI